MRLSVSKYTSQLIILFSLHFKYDALKFFPRYLPPPVAYPGIFSGGSTILVEDRENGDLGGGNPLVRDSGGSCNLVQEISFHIVKFSQFLVL